MATPSPAETEAPEQPQQGYGVGYGIQTEYGINFRDLPDKLKQAFLDAAKKAQGQEKYIRRQEVLQDAEHRFYDMGIQHIYCRNNQYQIAQPGVTVNVGGEELNYGTYIDDYNILTAFLLIQRAKLTQNLPQIDFQPSNPNEPDDMEAANAAEGIKIDFDRNSDMRALADQFFYHLQMGGRAAIWTSIEDDPEKFSSSHRGTPHRTAKPMIYGCLEHKVPILAANGVKDYPYFIAYDDIDINMAKEQYPWVAKKLSAGVCLAENEWERIARLGILQGAKGSRYQLNIGDSISHLGTRGHIWLRLASFNDARDIWDEGGTVPDEETGGQRQMQVRDKIAELFPDGVHFCAVGQEYVEAWDASMDECITVGHAYTGKGQSRQPIAKPMIVVQDGFNDACNMTKETIDYGAGSTFVACDEEDYDAIEKQESSPGAFHKLKQLLNGQDVRQMLWAQPSLEIPKTLGEFKDFLYQALPQFQLSVPPSIWGEALKGNDTASGYQLASLAAMGILGSFYKALATCSADMYYHAVLAVNKAANFPEEIVVERDGMNISVRKESLGKGKFSAYPDLEGGFPETTQAKRQNTERVIGLLVQTQSPVVAQLWQSPDNVAWLLREEGLTDLVLDEAVARDKQTREIEELLKGSPRMGPQLVGMLNGTTNGPDGAPDIADILQVIDQMRGALGKQAMIQDAAAQLSGQPAPPPPDPMTVARSSVRVWPTDYHQWHAKKCRDWLNGDDCHAEMTIGSNGVPNKAGVLNVILHLQEHLVFAAKEAPPPPAPLPRPVPLPPTGQPQAPAVPGQLQ
jgi:hypothetical protein